MAGREDQTEKSAKIRILYLMELLNRYSDEENPLTTNQIVQKLRELYGINVHRTTLPRDISILQEYGMDIVTVHSTQTKYFVGKRMFEEPELRLLIDAVEASRFITGKKSRQLIAKLKSLTSIYRAESLRGNMVVSDPIKPDNEKVYYIADAINDAINEERRIAFQYYEYSGAKEKVLRNGGEIYRISPYGLVWSGDYYYVVGYSRKHGKVVSFRVDRIASTPEILPESADPRPEGFDLARYAKEVFSMFDGESVPVELQCDNSLMKTIIDHFGEDVDVRPGDDASFLIRADISASPTFYGWVFGFGGKIRILGPDHIAEQYKQMVLEAARL